MPALEALRVDLAKRSRWNIGYFAAGFVYWTMAAMVGTMLPMETAKLIWLIGLFGVFPVALIFSKLFHADPFTRGNPLGNLLKLTHVGLIYLLLPLIIIFFLYLPEAFPLALAICLGASFLIFYWAFDHGLFLWHIVIRVIVATFMWFVLPATRYTWLPAFIALMYLVTVVIIPGRRHAWLRAQAAAQAAPASDERHGIRS